MDVFRWPGRPGGITYAVDVSRFRDSDADGLGDLQGLISRMPRRKTADRRLGDALSGASPHRPPRANVKTDVVEERDALLTRHLATVGDLVQRAATQYSREHYARISDLPRVPASTAKHLMERFLAVRMWDRESPERSAPVAWAG